MSSPSLLSVRGKQHPGPSAPHTSFQGSRSWDPEVHAFL